MKALPNVRYCFLCSVGNSIFPGEYRVSLGRNRPARDERKTATRLTRFAARAAEAVEVFGPAFGVVQELAAGRI